MMIDIFYINLDSRKDRLLSMQEQLTTLNLSAKRFSASVGKHLSTKERLFVDSYKFTCLMKRPVTDGEVGCASSHRRVWQYIVDHNIDYSLVMEDDVIIDKQVVEMISNYQNYQDFDFINLSSNSPYSYDEEVAKELLSQDVNERPINPKFLKLWKQLEWRNNWRIYKLKPIADNLMICECDPAPALGSGYIVSKKAAFEFLHASENLFYPIDYVWRYATGELRQGFMSTSLITQKQVDSDILGRDEKCELNITQHVHRLFLKRARRHRIKDIKKMYG